MGDNIVKDQQREHSFILTILSGENTSDSPYISLLDTFLPHSTCSAAIKATGGSGTIAVSLLLDHGDLGYGPEKSLETITIGGAVLEINLYREDWFGLLSHRNKAILRLVRSNSIGITQILVNIYRR